MAPHEAFRDVVRSHMQTAKKKGFDTLCGDFWMGHRIDPFNYNKFTKNEPEYVLENAKIAAEYLNIISVPSGSQETQEQKEKIARLEERLAKLEAVHTERLTLKKE